jgi:HAE1 family hydrophobic/amphiphilic exporter-1
MDVERPTPAPARDFLAGQKAFLTALVARPVATCMFVFSLAVFGAVSFFKLPIDLLPEISYPTLTVRTSWPGAAPEDVEERVSEKIQEALSTLDDLVRSTSISRAGASDVVLDFDWGTNMTFAVQDVREKLGGVFLPDGVERPLILRYDPNLDPILRIGIRVPEGRESTTDDGRVAELVQLRWLAEKRIKRELESIEGVAVAQVRGGLEEEIRVRTDPELLAAKRIDPSELAQRLSQENINASGGSLFEGSNEFLVRTVNQFRDLAEIEALPVVRRGDAVIRIGDVARVERGYEKREVISRIAGAESVEIAVYREAGANIVRLAELLKQEVFGDEAAQAAAQEMAQEERRTGRAADVTLGERARVDHLAWTLRREARLETLSDQSVFIRDAVDDVQSSAWVGGLLAIGSIWLFLRRLGPMLIIAVSIPVSIVVTFAPMFIGDVSMNIMSLGGLALGVGILVDNSIVVLESIASCREEGDDARQAAVRGTAEVLGAVFAATLTTVVVFAPIVFVTGIAGQIFGDQSLTVVSSLSISLLVAVFLNPVLYALPWFSRRVERPSGLTHGLFAGARGRTESVVILLGRVSLRVFGVLALALTTLGRVLSRALGIVLWPVHTAFDLAWGALDRSYPHILASALRARWPVILVSLGLLALALSRLDRLGLELLPEIHQGEFTAHVQLREGTPLQVTDEVLGELDRAAREVPQVATTALTVGVEKETLTREIEGSHTARLLVRLVPEGRSIASEDAATDRVRALLAAHPAVRSVEISRPTPFALEAPVAVEVRGYDLDALYEVAAEVRARLEAVPGLVDVRSSVRPGNPEVLISFDREKTLELGLDPGVVSQMVRDQVLGNVATRFHQGDERIGIRVMGDEAILDTVDRVLEMPINPSADSPVRLSTVADVERVQGPAEIRRIGNTRAVVVSADTTGLALGDVGGRIDRALASLAVRDDVTVAQGGQKREMDEAQASMRFALLLAIFLVYVVMACQFESIVQPLIIMLTVPMAAIGVILGLEALSIPISVVVIIGVIILVGIVVDNAIVLLDRVNQMRARGLTVDQALLEAGHSRLRPILMTAGTTVLGLLPMTGWLAWIPWVGALGAGEGAEIRSPMAVTVIAGMASSTLLTLIVIPAIYSIVEGWARPRAPAEGA